MCVRYIKNGKCQLQKFGAWMLSPHPLLCWVLSPSFQVSLSNAIAQVKQNSFPLQTLFNLHNKGNSSHPSTIQGRKGQTELFWGCPAVTKLSQNQKNWIFKVENHLEKKGFEEEQPMHLSSRSKASQVFYSESGLSRCSSRTMGAALPASCKVGGFLLFLTTHPLLTQAVCFFHLSCSPKYTP